MVFSAEKYEKAFPRKEPAAVKITEPDNRPGNVLEEAEKVIKKEPEVKEPDPAPEGNDPEGGEGDGTE